MKKKIVIGFIIIVLTLIVFKTSNEEMTEKDIVEIRTISTNTIGEVLDASGIIKEDVGIVNFEEYIDVVFIGSIEVFKGQERYLYNGEITIGDYEISITKDNPLIVTAVQLNNEDTYIGTIDVLKEDSRNKLKNNIVTVIWNKKFELLRVRIEDKFDEESMLSIAFKPIR